MPWRFRCAGCAGGWPGFVLAVLLAQVQGGDCQLARPDLRDHRRLAGMPHTDLPPEPMRRCQRALPGAPIHLDIETLGRFEPPCHLIAGTSGERHGRDAGQNDVHVAINVAKRLTYVQLLSVDGKAIPIGFLLRAALVRQPEHPGRTDDDRQGQRLPLVPLDKGPAPVRRPSNLNTPLYA